MIQGPITGRQVEGDMGAGVAGHGQHLDGPPQQAEAIAIAHPLGLEGDPLAVRRRGNHLELGPAP